MKKLFVFLFIIYTTACTPTDSVDHNKENNMMLRSESQTDNPENKNINKKSNSKKTYNKDDILESQKYINLVRERVDSNFDHVEWKLKKEVSEKKRNIFLNDFFDYFFVNSTDDFYRFNHYETQPNLAEKKRKIRELEIESILDKCVSIIGPEERDKKNHLLKVKQGIYLTLHVEVIKPEQEILDRALDIMEELQPNYLDGRNLKCVSYLYSHEYSLADFEYAALDNKNIKNRQEVEALYEKAYLKIKAAGLLRKITTAYYPKSLVREHADKTGLTKYIEQKQKDSKETLSHQDLASEYFGSRQKWNADLSKYITQKITKNKLVN